MQASWGHALVLTAEGDLHGLNLDTGEAHGLMRVCLPADVPQPWGAGGSSGWRLHASADGKHAALVQDAGRHGVLLAVDRKLEVAALYGGDYYPSTVPFSACFARHAGRDVLICRSDWNRLDVLDAATGDLLTDRLCAYEEPHYLDYFHGRLLMNPSGTHVLDDGWVWQPVGVPRTWSLAAWLDGNPWESEDGPSRLVLDQRDDWGDAAVWLDDTHAAMWNLKNGWEDDEGPMDTGHEPGLVIWPIDQGEFPAKERWPMPGLPVARALFRLGPCLAVVTERGTHWWRVSNRAHMGDWPDCAIQAVHQPRQTLLSWDASGVTEFSLSFDI